MAAALVLAVIVAGGCVLAAGTYWPAAETAEAPVLDGKEPGAAAPVVTPGGSKAAEPAKVVVQLRCGRRRLLPTAPGIRWRGRRSGRR